MFFSFGLYNQNNSDCYCLIYCTLLSRKWSLWWYHYCLFIAIHFVHELSNLAVRKCPLKFPTLVTFVTLCD
jgi:hypothetical protein